MRSKIIYFFQLLFFAVIANGNISLSKELLVYTYDSFNSKWGPGPIVFKRFEEICDCSLKIITPGDSGKVLNRIILEKANPKADIMIGLNNSDLEKSFFYNLWEPYSSKFLDRVPVDLLLDKKNRVTPFDYGFIGFVYDSQKIDEPPQNFKDLLDSKYKKKIVIQNPKTSSPGLSLLYWTIEVFGEKNFLKFWERLKPNLLAVTDGWSSAYAMFTRGETPIVLSYVTSPAYHLEYEKTERYQVAEFEGGHFRQIEFGGILKNTKNIELAKMFIDFMLSEEFQNIIPLTNWMFPVIQYQPLPDSFRIVPKVKKIQEKNPLPVNRQNSKWIKSWSRSMSE